jgi:hypothetical protein
VSDPAPSPRTLAHQDDGGAAAHLPSSPVTATLLPAGTAQRWVRISLVAGVELMVHEGGGEMAARLAHKIVSRYGSSTPS